MMEKGSLQPSQNPHSSQRNSEVDERVKRIPLPNQLPRGLDFKDIPAGAIKSSTLETLIGQNEDLMARLTVALRKTNELEDRAALSERELSALRNRLETMQEQYLVLQQKDRLANSRTVELHDQNISYKTKTAMLEKMYADIFVQAQKFQRRLIHLERYRARVKRASRGLRAQLADTRSLREQVQSHADQQVTIVNAYEARLTEAREMVETLRDKAAERDRIYDEKVRLENGLVFERRQAELSRADAINRAERLEKESASLRQELKEGLIERESQKQELERLRSETPYLRGERDRLTEQVESLQALWNHKQRELELLQEKNHSLQKLNQNISVTINQQRKEIHSLTSEKEQVRFAAEEKIKALTQEIQLLLERQRSSE